MDWNSYSKIHVLLLHLEQRKRNYLFNSKWNILPAPQRSTHCCCAPAQTPWKHVLPFSSHVEPSRWLSSSGHWNNEEKIDIFLMNDFVPEQTCHCNIRGHRKYFEMLDKCNPMEVICNQNNIHLIDIQLQDRICTFEDCNKLQLIYNSISNRENIWIVLNIFHLLYDCMSDKHACDLLFRISFSSTLRTEFNQINLR